MASGLVARHVVISSSDPAVSIVCLFYITANSPADRHNAPGLGLVPRAADRTGRIWLNNRENWFVEVDESIEEIVRVCGERRTGPCLCLDEIALQEVNTSEVVLPWAGRSTERMQELFYTAIGKASSNKQIRGSCSETDRAKKQTSSESEFSACKSDEVWRRSEHRHFACILRACAICRQTALMLNERHRGSSSTCHGDSYFRFVLFRTICGMLFEVLRNQCRCLLMLGGMPQSWAAEWNSLELSMRTE
jgi:hypothetical protein